MRINPQAGVPLPVEEEHRRRTGRLSQEAVVCNYGPVRDLSAGGMSVVCRRVPRGRIVVEIRGMGMTLRAWARVVWTRRIGFLKREIGLEFLDVDEELERNLTTIAMNHRYRRTMP